MKIMKGLAFGFVLLVVSGFESLPNDSINKQYVSNFENVLGTSLEVKITSTSAEESGRAEEVVLKEIERIEKILSGYDPSSEFSQWLKTKDVAVKVSPELFEVLGLFDQWRVRTDGALDASAEVVGRVWKAAAARQHLPNQDELNRAVSLVKQTHWKLDGKNQTATHMSNAPLMLNSFAKSYIINKAVDAAMKSSDVSAMVLNIGGDIVVRGDLNESILVTDPRANAENDVALERIKINNKAIATSGNYKRGVNIEGHWYSHIVDPRTGEPVDHVISATVVADDATDAGALATTFNVLKPEEAMQLASTMPGIEYLLITREGECIESNGWKYLEEKEEIKKADTPLLNGPANAWDTNYELIVNFEIKKQQGYAPRPFVAVWIETASRVPVRNLAIWFGRQRWLPDLRSWYRMNYAKAEKAADNSSIVSVASATRSPGLYTLKWDGKDDEGNLVEAGKYIIYIEAAREQGTYQIIKQEMEFTGTPKQMDLFGNAEIASASLDYRKKP